MKLINTTVLFEGMLLLIIGFASIIEGVRLVNMGKDYSHDIFGPGRYLFGIGLVLIILGLTYLILQRGKKLEGEKLFPKKETRIKMLGMIIAMPVYTLLIPIIGYFFATGIFFIIMHRVVGFRSWLINSGLSIGISFCFYVVFVLWLSMIFPQGLLFK